MRYRHSIAAGLALLCVVRSADAWGFKEHIQLTRMAVARLIADPTTTPEMKAWLRKLVPDARTLDGEKEWFLKAKVGEKPLGLTTFDNMVIKPDVRSKDRKLRVPPLNLPERMMHFLDMEMFLPAEASKKYSNDLKSKAAPDAVPHDAEDKRFVQAGGLPFAVENSYQQLVKSIREGRLMPDPATPGNEDNALRWAGFLSHYTQDNCQPLHATEDYQSKAYFADQKKAPNVHSELEWRMNDDAAQDFPQLRADFWDAFVKELDTFNDPIKTDEPWDGSVEVSSLSYDALPLIGQAAMAAAGQGGTVDKPEGPTSGAFDTEKFFRFEGTVRGEKMTVLQLKARQQAWAVLRTQKLLKQAWTAAQGPEKQ